MSDIVPGVKVETSVTIDNPEYLGRAIAEFVQTLADHIAELSILP